MPLNLATVFSASVFSRGSPWKRGTLYGRIASVCAFVATETVSLPNARWLEKWMTKMAVVSKQKANDTQWYPKAESNLVGCHMVILIASFCWIKMWEFLGRLWFASWWERVQDQNNRQNKIREGVSLLSNPQKSGQKKKAMIKHFLCRDLVSPWCTLLLLPPHFSKQVSPTVQPLSCINVLSSTTCLDGTTSFTKPNSINCLVISSTSCQNWHMECSHLCASMT